MKVLSIIRFKPKPNHLEDVIENLNAHNKKIRKFLLSDEKMAGVHMGVTLLPLLYESITHRLYQKDTSGSLILFDRSRHHTGAKPTVVKT